MQNPHIIAWTKIKRIAAAMAQADFVFYLMPVLIVLLIAGTIAQREIGLHAAHQMFFASFIFWAGPIPLPGGYLILGLLTLNLTLKFVFFSDWGWKKAGIILAHLGALILLIGGLLTAIMAKENYMMIPEGQQTPYTYDYIQRELMVYKNNNLLYALPFDTLKRGKIIPLNIPLQIKTLDSCANCKIIKRENSEDYSSEKPYQSMAQFMALKDKPREKDPEADLAGVTMDIRGLDNDQNGTYIAFDAMPKPIEITYGDDTYTIIFGKSQTQLPFSIRLIDFQKQTYPGMEKAKSYSSDIVVIDNGVEWPTRIEMNKPLRYRGYTFFQSSFDQTPETEITILSVVENESWLFPYIGTGVLGLGLLLHCILMIRRRKPL